jgi:hypothetical protein
MNTIRSTFDKVKTDLLVDIGIFLGFLLALDPHSTGITIHEWLSVALAAAVMAHLLLHWSWIVNVTRRFFQNCARQSRLNYILNVALFIDMTVIMFTGLMISRSVLPALGLQPAESFLWRGLHSFSADLSLFLIGLHIALHWRWIIATLKRYVVSPFLPAKRMTPVKVEVQKEGRS